MLLVPAMMFFLLWPNWGSTLYGEIRGASDFKRVFIGMFSGLWLTVILTVVFLLLVAKTFGWDFFQNMNAAYYYGVGKIPIWPYPFMFAGWLVHNTVFQVVLILALSLWFFGWVGTLFLSSTRVIFAAAFDRVLPDRAAEVSEKRKVPVWSLILMLLPAAGLSAIYAYSTTFRSYTLDATLVIAVTYLFSAIAVVILPWRKPDLWRASPASRVKLLGVPIVPVAGVITIGLLGFNLYYWFTNDNYFVNNAQVPVLHGRHVRARDRHLRGRADHPQPAGNRPWHDQQGDPGRVNQRGPVPPEQQAASAAHSGPAAPVTTGTAGPGFLSTPPRRQQHEGHPRPGQRRDHRRRDRRQRPRLPSGPPGLA